MTDSAPSSARLLRCWGKTGATVEQFHPAVYHMLDVGSVARALLGSGASPRWRRVLGRVLCADPNELCQWLPWLIALHDVGKLSPAFQGQATDQRARLAAEGFSFDGWRPALEAPHNLISEVFLAGWHRDMPEEQRLPDPLAQAWREMAGSHHGRFSSPEAVRQVRTTLAAHEPAEWGELRAGCVKLLAAQLLDAPPAWPEPANRSAATMALTGFSILCDWLGSDAQVFTPAPSIDLRAYALESECRAQRAVAVAGFLQPCVSTAARAFSALFPERAGRPLQLAIDAIPADLLSEPTLAIIEAPTGEGKTEAALALAHRLAEAAGTDEIYYALPTTATSNQMFGRLLAYLQGNLRLSAGVKLVHGQAFLVEDDLLLQQLGNGREGQNASAAEWFAPKKRALLAPFGVGTIDQAELAALNVKHDALRMAGLAGKVLIVDEVHAYDTYMTTIVERLLEWLASLGTSVILLSATLPLARRAALTRAYAAQNSAAASADGYPSLQLVSARGSYQTFPPAYQPDRSLGLGRLHLPGDDAEGRARWLLDQVKYGGCACWITNTVERAQRMFDAVDRAAARDVDRLVLHARFPLDERQVLETELAAKYGPQGRRPTRGIVIGTQVLEQSLDIDFDVMASDLAPIDLLLQRAGRLQRHPRARPAAHPCPCLWINTELDPSGELSLNVDALVYAEFILRQTWAVLRDLAELHLPMDYRPLIEAVYGCAPPEASSTLAPAWSDLQRKEQRAVEEARLRLLPRPDADWSFCSRAGRLQFEELDNSAAWIVAQTRLGEESINIIPLELCDGGALAAPGGPIVALDRPAPRYVELQMLRRSLRISQPAVVRALKTGDQELTPLFAESVLLNGYRPLWLRNGRALLPVKDGTFVLTLDPRVGLVIERPQ